EVIAANNDLPVPPPLDVAAAQQLNQAYALELPLEQLLRQHRLLALSRAPLGQRLLVLRRIAELDLTNPVWPADIRTFEEARLKELRGEFARAAEELDAVTLGRLRHELTGFAWSAPPPPDLVARVEQTHRRAEIAEARAELSRLESRLSAAAAARDVEEARRLRDQIDRVARDAALPPDDPALRRLRFPLAWVDEQDRKDADREALRRELGTLTGMLDGATPLPELEAQYLLVNSLCDAVPAEVERQYRARVGELRARRQRRRILAASGSVLAVVLLLGVIALWYTRAAHARRARDVERQLQTYLDNRQTPRARALYDEVARREPSVAEDPRVVAQRQRLEREEELDRDRAARFDAAYKEALEIPPGDPRESVKFQELERLATTPEQRTGLARLREERDQLARRARERLEEETLEQLRKVSEELTRLPASATDPAKLAAVRKRLAELERQVAGARAGSGGLGEHVRQWLTAAENQARERRQALDACERQLRQIDAITLALKKEDLGRFAELARGYARDFAGTPRANAFASTFKEYPAWEAVADWNRLCRERKVGVFQRLSCDEARAQLPELEQYLAEHAEALGANPGLFPPELVPRYARFIR
ncbi:MAG TPA: hypothetical protein VIL46_10605, partial [Gemmataceae bacterium]